MTRLLERKKSPRSRQSVRKNINKNFAICSVPRFIFAVFACLQRIKLGFLPFKLAGRIMIIYFDVHSRGRSTMKVKRNSKQLSLLYSQGAQGTRGKRKKFNSAITSGSDAENINFIITPKYWQIAQYFEIKFTVMFETRLIYKSACNRCLEVF